LILEDEEFMIIDYDIYYQILFDCFTVLDEMTDDEIDFEEWRYQVDVQYREIYEEFPVLDEEILDRLPELAEDVYHQMHSIIILDFEKVLKDEMISELSDRLLNSIDNYLEIRSQIFSLEYPHDQRFQRREIWALDEDHEWDEDDDEHVDEILNSLVDKGFIRLLEHGGKAKYDTFQTVEV